MLVDHEPTGANGTSTGNARARGGSGLALSISDYARHRGCTRKAVYDALNAGAIRLNASKKLDVAETDAAWEANIPPDNGKRSRERERDSDPNDDKLAPDGGESRTMAETRKVRAAADLAEVALALKRGELVPREQVERESFEVHRAIRSRVFAVPAALAARVRACATDADARTLILSALRTATNAAADDIDALSSAQEATCQDPSDTPKGDPA